MKEDQEEITLAKKASNLGRVAQAELHSTVGRSREAAILRRWNEDWGILVTEGARENDRNRLCIQWINGFYAVT